MMGTVLFLPQRWPWPGVSIKLVYILVCGQSSAGFQTPAPGKLGCLGELFSASLWGFVWSSVNAALSSELCAPSSSSSLESPSLAFTDESCQSSWLHAELHVLQGTGNQELLPLPGKFVSRSCSPS